LISVQVLRKLLIPVRALRGFPLFSPPFFSAARPVLPSFYVFFYFFVLLKPICPPFPRMTAFHPIFPACSSHKNHGNFFPVDLPTASLPPPFPQNGLVKCLLFIIHTLSTGFLRKGLFCSESEGTHDFAPLPFCGPKPTPSPFFSVVPRKKFGSGKFSPSLRSLPKNFSPPPPVIYRFSVLPSQT